MNIKIHNIVIENLNYVVDYDDPTYDYDEHFIKLNKTYEFKLLDPNDISMKIEDYLEQIAYEYCDDRLDTCVKDIQVHADVIIKDVVY